MKKYMVLLLCVAASAANADVLLECKDFSTGIDPAVWSTSGYVTTEGSFAKIYSPTTVGWTTSSMTTVNSYAVAEDGVNLTVDLMFHANEPGDGTYRPLFTVLGASNETFLKVGCDNATAGNPAPLYVDAMLGGSLQRLYTSEALPQSVVYTLDFTYHPDGAAALVILKGSEVVFDSGDVVIDNTLTSMKLKYQTSDGGWWPGATMYTRNIVLETIPEPATVGMLMIGGLGVLVRRHRKA